MSEEEQHLAVATKSGALGSTAAGVIAAILAVVPTLLQLYNVAGTAVAVTMLAVAGVSIVVAGAVVINDAQVRGRVKVAQFEKAAAGVTVPAQPALAVAAPPVPTAPAEWHPLNVPMAITFSGGSDRWGVVALRSEADGSSSFLAGRSGRTLRVVPETELDETFYESNPGQFEPRVGA